MAEQESEQKKAERTRRGLRWWPGICLSAAAIVLGLLWIGSRWQHHSVDEQLAAIQAARAIPESENAAVFYNTLDGSRLAFESAEDDLGAVVERAMRTSPWTASDYPEAAQWLQEHQGVIETLLKASLRPECRFAIDFEVRYSHKSRNLVHAWTRLLQRAANNDIGEGRMGAAIEKCRCLLQFAEHLRQQPTFIDHLLSVNAETAALRTLANVIMDNRSTQIDLDAIAALPIPTELTWTKNRELMTEVENLYEAKRRANMSVLRRLREWFAANTVDEYIEAAQRSFLYLLAERRGAHIIIALKRHRNIHGHWPDSLDQLHSSLPETIMTDPLNDGPISYRSTDDGFVLYSKGPNGIDEGGSYSKTSDDWRIWPRRYQKTKQQDAKGK
jgi:hypothetical protein